MKSRKKERSTIRSDPPQSKVGDIFEIGADGQPTNGRIMLELLGDEPDVSSTSLALARKLGLSKQILKMLGEGRDTDLLPIPDELKTED